MVGGGGGFGVVLSGPSCPKTTKQNLANHTNLS
jgi:hypothetical protein